jgi:hypothetical protein
MDRETVGGIGTQRQGRAGGEGWNRKEGRAVEKGWWVTEGGRGIAEGREVDCILTAAAVCSPPLREIRSNAIYLSILLFCYHTCLDGCGISLGPHNSKNFLSCGEQESKASNSDHVR